MPHATSNIFLVPYLNCFLEFSMYKNPLHGEKMSLSYVGSIDLLVEAYQKLKQEDFDGIRKAQFVCGEVIYKVTVDKRSELIKKFQALGFDQLRDDLCYSDQNESYMPATFVVTKASMDEADLLLSSLMKAHLRVRCEFNHLYSNIPVLPPKGIWQNIKVENAQRGALGRDDEALSVEEFRGPLARVSSETFIEKYIFDFQWVEINAPISKDRIKVEYAKMDAYPLYALFSERWPKVDPSTLLSGQDADPEALYSSADTVRIESVSIH